MYDPSKSKVSDNTMSEWLANPLTMDLSMVPGLGVAGIKFLAESEDSITNLPMLFGKYLSLKGPGEVSVGEHNDRFWFYLQDLGIKAHRSAVVKAIALKSCSLFPTLYDASVYDDGDSDDE